MRCSRRPGSLHGCSGARINDPIEANEEANEYGTDLWERSDIALPALLEGINEEDPSALAEWGVDPRVVERWILRMQAASERYYQLSEMLGEYLGIQAPPPPVADLNIADDDDDDEHEPGVVVVDVTLD
ncbi:hypothetical protein LTR86_003727 [Recurvomyces mirabilis]|nr:hypothetical protein LTR86_003727 [Recurvomyces mirabilis]